jgi:hypothetical protein
LDALTVTWLLTVTAATDCCPSALYKVALSLITDMLAFEEFDRPVRFRNAFLGEERIFPKRLAMTFDVPFLLLLFDTNSFRGRGFDGNPLGTFPRQKSS